MNNVSTWIAGSPVETQINNLANIIFGIVRSAGVIMLIWGIVAFATSLKSHDASQRSSAVIIVVGGLIVFFVKELLALLGVTI